MLVKVDLTKWMPFKGMEHFDVTWLLRMKVIEQIGEGSLVFTIAAKEKVKGEESDAPVGGLGLESAELLREVNELYEVVFAYFKYANFSPLPPLNIDVDYTHRSLGFIFVIFVFVSLILFLFFLMLFAVQSV